MVDGRRDGPCHIHGLCRFQRPDPKYDGWIEGDRRRPGIPTDSSKLLPGYYLFVGFCMASLLLSKKLERGIRTSQSTEPG